MFFKNLCVLVLWSKVASASEGLKQTSMQILVYIRINIRQYNIILINFDSTSIKIHRQRAKKNHFTLTHNINIFLYIFQYEHIKSNAGNQESPARKRIEKGKLNHAMLGPSDGADISSIRFNQPSFHFRPGYMSDSSSAFSSLSSITGSRIYLPHKNK